MRKPHTVLQRLLTTFDGNQAAVGRLLKLSRKTINRWVTHGRIPDGQALYVADRCPFPVTCDEILRENQRVKSEYTNVRQNTTN